MDQTIIDSSDPYLFQRPPTPEARVILKRKIRELLNWNVVNIIKRAAALRPSGRVSAICLLTNNSSHILVSAVDEVLYEETRSKGKYKTYAGNVNDRDMPPRSEPYFFDSIMMRQHSSRPKTMDDNPPKRLIDILNMLKFIGISEAGLDSIYFFDDIGTHYLRAEFTFMSEGKYKDHYIQITPPFRKILTDRTNYEPILRALSNIDGMPAELNVLERRGPVMTVYRSPRQRNNGPPPAVPPPPTPYRPRSNAGVNENNLGLPPPPQEQSIRKKGTIARPSLLGAFTPTKGGSRKTRRKRRSTRRKNL